MTARKTAGHESWDAFWSEVSRGRTEVIRGVEVPVPTDLPLAMEGRVEELENSSRLEDVQELVALLFGVDVLGAWIDEGMGLKEFQTVLTWGTHHASGREISFREAFELVEQGDGKGQALGPGRPNRAARRAAPAKRSAAGGGRSKRTSSGSTGSARKTSRG